MLRDRKAEHREAARHRLKTISQMFDWALENDVEGVRENPVRHVKYPKPLPGGGHHTWSVQEKEAYERQHPVGSKARLGFALLYYTGLRVSDVVRLGRRHIQKNGSFKLTLHKNRNRYPVTLELPILDELQAILDATEVGAETFLVTEWGKPFASEKAFGNKVRDWCDRAGLRHCTAHGLRKAGATIAAENGATAHELKAMFGWLTLKQAEAYTRMAEQKLLAARGMQRLSGQKKLRSGT
jgi:site-specific recombinase XerD